MINAKELRIGNLVDFNGQVETVYAIRNSGVDFYRGKTKKSVIMQSYLWEAIKPIKLTEEWLFKFGFKNDRVLEFYRNDFTDSTIIIDYNFICLLGYSHVKLKYVHQLQNLYFTLTNEELTLKF